MLCRQFPVCFTASKARTWSAPVSVCCGIGAAFPATILTSPLLGRLFKNPSLTDPTAVANLRENRGVQHADFEQETPKVGNSCRQ